MRPDAGSDSEKRKVYQVSEINRLSKLQLESAFGNVWVEGEISNLKRPQSGHLYFSLKDAQAQIRAVLFRGNQRNLKFQPADGIKVRARGTISIYTAAGSYQIICSHLEEAGKGSLQEAFEKLKKKLREEGLFEPERKRRLPMLPQHVGVVTSATGAAIRDILNVARRRFPNLHILVAPVLVQGDDAARQIAHAIDHFNQRGGIDVMIIGRGGGSLEDLWAFNEEIVARAIARSGIPVISAVGHETDFTISDFVADVRAPTPSAAAEIVVGQKEEFEQRLQHYQHRLRQTLKTRYLELRNRLNAAAQSYVFKEPENLLKMHRQSLGSLLDRMAYCSRDSLRNYQQRVDEFNMRRNYALKRAAELAATDLERLRSQLTALDPHRVLRRGYSITRGADGAILRSVDGVKSNDRIQTKIGDGEIISNVVETRRDEDDREKED